MEWFDERLHRDWRQGIRIREVVFEERTEHQELLIFDSYQWGRVLALDGVVQTTTGDEFCYHEMIVHVPIMAHGAAREVLVIGGGDGGCLREALKHPGVERVTQVEIDQGVIELCRKWLPSISDGAFDHPKARVVIADGARFAAESEERFDVVVVDSTDPQGPGAVLFTERFYRDARRLLRPGGIMATQCGNPSIRPDELVDTQAAQRAAGFALVDYYLPVVPTYVGGAMALGFATADEPAARRVTAEELRARGVPAGLRYYTPEIHLASFAHPAWMAGRVGH
jgi:spermidine synthase